MITITFIVLILWIKKYRRSYQRKIKFGVDSGSFLIVDPAYIDKMEIFKKNDYKYNAPKIKKSNIDIYVELNYRMDDNLANKYSVSEYGFMNVVQKFAQNQIELDEEFSSALDELFTSKINSKPTKKRF